MSNTAESVETLMERFRAEMERNAAMTPAERANLQRELTAERMSEVQNARRLHAVQRLGDLGQFPENVRAWHLKVAREPSDLLLKAIPGLRVMPTLPDQEKPMEMLKSWFLRAADNLYSSRGPWLIAPPGRGKTAVLAAWANSLHAYFDRPLSVLYVNWANVVAESEDKGADFESESWADAMKRADVLVLDEIGTFKDTSRSHKLAYKVLDYRCGARNKLTAVSSNYGPEEMKKQNLFGPQQIDRLVGLCPRMYQCGWYGTSLRENPPVQLEMVR